MRRLLVVLAAVAFCSIPTWADNIEYDVNAWATFTATQPCSSNCTETIAMNFLYKPPSDFLPSTNSVLSYTGEIVPGSMDESSSGFVGSLIAGATISTQAYVPFSDLMGDEFDLDVPVRIGTDQDGIQPGFNTLGFELFYCPSEVCQTKMRGPNPIELHPGPTSYFTVVTPVQVPDGDSSLPISLSALGAFALVWRWRRREA